MFGYTKSDVMSFVTENDVKFIRLAFCDLNGTHKNISILPSELERAFSCGIAFNAPLVEGFSGVTRDLYLRPDPTTLAVLPWRPQQGRVIRLYCDVTYDDGKPFEGDCRHLLKAAAAELQEKGYVMSLGTECEFYLFALDESGRPTKAPHDFAGYCDIAPMDRGENVRREICLSLEQMDVMPESSHHEQGPGQNEIDFGHSDPLTAADNFMTYKSVVKAIAARSGLYASFMPKPFEDKSGSGLHINISLEKDGKKLFTKFGDDGWYFLAGILNRVGDMTAVLNSTVNSYRRHGSFDAPKYVTYSRDNSSELASVPRSAESAGRMELRSADAAINPYLAFTLLIRAGLAGIESKEPLPKSLGCAVADADENQLAKIETVPAALGTAVERFCGSEFVRSAIPVRTAEQFAELKRRECDAISGYSEERQFGAETDMYFYRL